MAGKAGRLMPVDDLWYLKKRGPNNKRLPSKLHGKGKRWRVRYQDADGADRTKFFDREVDAKEFDAEQIVGVTRDDHGPSPADRALTYKEYAERWRISRRIGHALDYQRHLESRLRPITIRTSATDSYVRSTSPTFWNGSPNFSPPTLLNHRSRPTTTCSITS